MKGPFIVYIVTHRPDEEDLMSLNEKRPIAHSNMLEDAFKA